MLEQPLRLAALGHLAHLQGDDLGTGLGARGATIEAPLDDARTTTSTPATQSGMVAGSNQATGTLAVPVSVSVVTSRRQQSTTG